MFREKLRWRRIYFEWRARFARLICMAACRFRCLIVAAQLMLAGAGWQARAQGATPTPAAASPVGPEFLNAAPGTKLHDSRVTFVQAVKEGTLVGFDEATGSVTFRPTKPGDLSHEPGPMEDEVIASAVRAGAVADQSLRGVKVKVECQGGTLRIAEGNADAVQLAALIQLALGVDGVRSVCAELPHGLRMLPAS